MSYWNSPVALSLQLICGHANFSVYVKDLSEKESLGIHAEKMNFSITVFLRKCKQTFSFLQISAHLL